MNSAAGYKRIRQKLHKNIEIVFCKKLFRTHRKLWQIIETRFSFEQRLRMAKRIQVSKSFEILTKMKAAQTLVKKIERRTRNSTKGGPFTFAQKKLCLPLYNKSPEAYEILSEICILPKRNVLEELLDSIKVTPGINDYTFNKLKGKVHKMTMRYRYCCVIFGEMVLTPKFTVSSDGNGTVRSKVFADTILVFMVRGAVKRYELPVAYSWSVGTTKSDDLKRQLKEIIKKLTSVGFIVIASVCDHCFKHRKVINQLVNETKEVYTEKGLTHKGIFFQIGKSRVVPLYDVSDLMIGIRNKLLRTDLNYIKDGENKVARWINLQSFYKHQKPMNIVPHLTARHVVPRLIPKKNVDFAIQVFDDRVARFISLVAAIEAPDAVMDTAHLLMLFHNLNESAEGSASELRYAEETDRIYLMDVKPKSAHHKLWRESLPILQTIKYVTNNNEEVSMPITECWSKTIRGFQCLVCRLRQKNVKSVFMSNFNKKPLEDFFASFRKNGVYKPTAYQFEVGFKTFFINKMCRRIVRECAVDILIEEIESFVELNHL